MASRRGRSLGSSWILVTLLFKAMRERDHQRPLSTSFFPSFVLSSPLCLPSCPILVTTSHAAGLCKATGVKDSLNAALVPEELSGVMRQPGKQTLSMCHLLPPLGRQGAPGAHKKRQGTLGRCGNPRKLHYGTWSH